MVNPSCPDCWAQAISEPLLCTMYDPGAVGSGWSSATAMKPSPSRSDAALATA